MTRSRTSVPFASGEERQQQTHASVRSFYFVSLADENVEALALREACALPDATSIACTAFSMPTAKSAFLHDSGREDRQNGGQPAF